MLIFRSVTALAMLLAGNSRVYSGQYIDIHGCHGFRFTGPAEMVGLYRDAQSKKFAPIDEGLVDRMRNGVHIAVRNEYFDPARNYCRDFTGVPERIVFTERNRRESVVLTVPLEAERVTLQNALGAAYVVYDGSGKLSIEAVQSLLGKEYDVYLVYLEASNANARKGIWKRGYSEKLLSPSAK